MHEIKLPSELMVGEGYGNLIWSIRGVYEGYAGFFDMQPATMYDVPLSAVFPDLAKLSGGADAVAKSRNSNERGWLDYHIRLVKRKLSG